MAVVRTTIWTFLTLLVIASAASIAFGQLHPPEFKGLRGVPFPSMNPPPDVRSYGEGPAWDGRPPDGVQPLPLDMFAFHDFDFDRIARFTQRDRRRLYGCNRPHGFSTTGTPTARASRKATWTG